MCGVPFRPGQRERSAAMGHDGQGFGMDGWMFDMQGLGVLKGRYVHTPILRGGLHGHL